VTSDHDVQKPIYSYNSSQEANATYTILAYVFYYYQNQTYSQQYFQDPDNVQCVATGVYQWGFSIIPTLVFAVLNCVWIIVTYGVWVHMNRKSELYGKGRRLGKYRAAIDVVDSIQQDLGRDTCAYSEKELKDKLAEVEGIKYYVEHSDGDAPSHIGISSSMDGGPVKLRFGELYGRETTSS
jgi:hypothetical protein